jgi:hypothetical protein
LSLRSLIAGLVLIAGLTVPVAAQAKAAHPHHPPMPKKLVALEVTDSRVVLDWVGPQHRAKGLHFTIFREGEIARRTKHTRVTLTARTGIACDASYRLTVVAVDRRGHASQRAKAITVKTAACPASAPTGPTPAVTTTPPTTAPSAPTVPPTTLPARDAAYWPFAVTSPWNMPIGTGAAFGGTGDARTASMLNIAQTYINSSQYTVPVYVATSSDPVNTISSPQDTVTARIPAAAAQSGGSDGFLTVIDPTHTYVDELFVASKTGTTSWYAERHERSSIRTNGMGEYGVRASSFNVIGGVIRKYDVDSGAIRHALVMAIPQTAAKKGYVWPATSEDTNNSGYHGAIPLGSLFAIPPTVNLATLGLSADGMILAKALQSYGVYVADTSGAPTINLSMFAEPTLDNYPAIDHMRTDLDKLKAQLRIVTNNTPNSVGGGGTPRQPLAPGFG